MRSVKKDVAGVGKREECCLERKTLLFLNRSGLGAGEVSYRHKFVDMTKVVVEASKFTRAGKTCPAAMGFSFAAGTTDGKPHRPEFIRSRQSVQVFPDAGAWSDGSRPGRPNALASCNSSCLMGDDCYI